jgi:hypothetical protein
MAGRGIVFTVHWRTREVLSVAGGNDSSPDAPHRHPHKAKLRQPHLGPKCVSAWGLFYDQMPTPQARAALLYFVKLVEWSCVCRTCSNRPSKPMTANVPLRSFSTRSASNPTMSRGTASRKTGRLTASSERASSVSGYRPRPVFWPKLRLRVVSNSRRPLPRPITRGRNCLQRK